VHSKVVDMVTTKFQNANRMRAFMFSNNDY